MTLKHLKLFDTFTNKVVIGIDIDGTINNFSDAYNILYKQYFPDKEVYQNDDWEWYKKMDYNGDKPGSWLASHKAETFDLSLPYPNAVVSLNNIYDFVKTYGFALKIVSSQPTKEAEVAAEAWLNRFGFKFDEIVFVKDANYKWNYVDIMVDDAEKVIGSKPLSKVSIKINQKWNENISGDINIPNIAGLTITVMKDAISKLKNKTTV
jgi:hypothetical protein